MRRLKYILYYNITGSKTNNVFWNIKTIKVKYSFSYVLYIIMCPFSYICSEQKMMTVIHFCLYSRKTSTKMCFGVKTVQLKKASNTRFYPFVTKNWIIQNIRKCRMFTYSFICFNKPRSEYVVLFYISIILHFHPYFDILFKQKLFETL